MALYRWPTDPKGKPARHTVPYAQRGGIPRPASSSWGRGVGGIPRPASSSWGRGVPAAPPGAAAPAASAAPAPAAPAAPPPGSVLPVDPAYDAQVGLLQRQRDTGYAGVTGARQRTLSDYGYREAGYDPAKGQYGALSIDSTNPFSKASLLKRNYDTQRRSAAQSMGAGGQLYSGAFQSTQDVTNRNQLQAQDALQKSLQEFLIGNTGQRTQVGTDYELGVAGAQGDRIGRAPSNPLYEPAVSPDVPASQTLTTQPVSTRAKIITNKLGHKGRWVTRPDGTKYFQRI